MQAIVLFAHGSRDPDWRRPIEAVARRIEQRSPGVAVRCAYLELCAPDLPAAVRELAAAGVTALRVVPLFLGMGRHAREDLPQLVTQLRAAHPGLAIELASPVGEDPRLTETMAEIATR